MTLVLVPEEGLNEIYRIRSGNLKIATIERGGPHSERWKWSIYWLYEPGWNWSGSNDTRDDAMAALGTQFRRWLDFAGLEETDDLSARDGAPFLIEDMEGKRRRVRSPTGLYVGCVEPHLTVEALVSMPRKTFWVAWINKFTPRFRGSGWAGQTEEEAVAGIATGFRTYIASAGLREKA
jgi:hypothetical protein